MLRAFEPRGSRLFLLVDECRFPLSPLDFSSEAELRTMGAGFLVRRLQKGYPSWPTVYGSANRVRVGSRTPFGVSARRRVSCRNLVLTFPVLGLVPRHAVPRYDGVREPARTRGPIRVQAKVERAAVRLLGVYRSIAIGPVGNRFTLRHPQTVSLPQSTAAFRLPGGLAVPGAGKPLLPQEPLA